MELPKMPDVLNIKEPHITAAMLVHSYTSELEKKLKVVAFYYTSSILCCHTSDMCTKTQVIRPTQLESIKILIGLIEENIKTTEAILKLAELKEI